MDRNLIIHLYLIFVIYLFSILNLYRICAGEKGYQE